jgi:hypothetical protein
VIKAMNKHEKLIPAEKLSKKERKKLNLRARRSWNGVNPITKTVESKKVYKRARFKRQKDD